MTSNVSFNKRNYADIQSALSRKVARTARKPIDPKLILAQGELIRLKGEVRYQFYCGFNFEKISENSVISKVGKVLNPDGAVQGYVKVLSNSSNFNNAIIEKIRWDLAVMAGDYPYHAPTQLMVLNLPRKRPIVCHIQPHLAGNLVFEAIEKNKSSIPKQSVLKSLIMTIVYGGFDDHLGNLMLQDAKIIHFDNAGSLPYGSKFIQWDGLLLLCIRPVILKAKETEALLLSEDIEFIKRELHHYLNCLPQFEAYFERIDVKKMISKGDSCLIDPVKSIQGMRERITLALSGLNGENPKTAREWIFSSFPYFRAAMALVMVKGRRSFEEALSFLNGKSLEEVINDVANIQKDPLQVIKLALEIEDLDDLSHQLIMMPRCEKNYAFQRAKIAIEFIKASSEIELKNGLNDRALLIDEVLSELEACGAKLETRGMDLYWNNVKIAVLPNKTIVPVKAPLHLSPLSVDDIKLNVHGQKEPTPLNRFVDELLKHNVPLASGPMHAIEPAKLAMFPNTYRVFQVRDFSNNRFFLTEKDGEGRIKSQSIDFDIEKILKVKEKYAQLKSNKPAIEITQIEIENNFYKVYPGECPGTFVIQIDKLRLPPMYKDEIREWLKGPKTELGLINALKVLNVYLGIPGLKSLADGEHILVQERDATPMAFTVYQRPRHYPNVYTYRILNETSRGLRCVSEMGVTFFVDRMTVIARLKNGIRLDGVEHAGIKS